MLSENERYAVSALGGGTPQRELEALGPVTNRYLRKLELFAGRPATSRRVS